MMTPGENHADLEAKNKTEQNKITMWRSDAPVRCNIPKHSPWPHTVYVFGFLPILGTWVVSREGSVPIPPAISPIPRAGHTTESRATDIELVATRVHLCPGKNGAQDMAV